MSSLALTLKELLKAERQAAIDTFQGDGRPEKLLTKLRQNVDSALAQGWYTLGLPSDASLVAVGGYGRGELFPYSDVDVLILLNTPPDAAQQERLERLIQMFWDIG